MKYLIYIFGLSAVIYPVLVWWGRVGPSFGADVSISLFPLFGLIAISIMWLHVLGGAFRGWLQKYINFEKFVFWSSIIVFFSIIFHPLLLITRIGFENFGLIFEYNEPKYIWFAIAAWFILVGYDIAKKFRNRGLFIKHWNKVKLVSNIGFFFALYHSLGVGSDLQDGPLRYVWIFYGISGICATVYTYGYKRIVK